MKEFQSIVKDFISDRERHMRYVAFLTVMCVIVSIAVPFSLIMPAVSETGVLTCGLHEHNSTCYDENNNLICGFSQEDVHVHTEECYSSIDDDSQYIQLNALTTASDGAYPVLGNIGTASPSVKQENLGESTNTVYKVLVQFYLNFTLPKDVFVTENNNVYISTSGNVCVTYQIDGDTMEKLEMSTDHKNVEILASGIKAGTFTATAEGLITLKFDQEYLNEHIKELTEGSGLTGELYFDAYATRDENNLGDVYFYDNDDPIKFPEKEVTLEKNGIVNAETGNIDWTVTISTDNEINWKGYYIQDDMLSIDSCNLVSTTPTNCGSISDGKFTFGDVTSNKVSFTYSIPILDAINDFSIDNESSVTVSNTAELYTEENSKVKETTKTVECKPLTIDKSSSVRDGKVYWTININNPSGFDLSSYRIVDTAFSSANDLDISIIPSNIGNTHNSNSDEITINGIAEQVTITYSTDITTENIFSGGEIPNTVYLKDTDDNIIKEDEETVPYTNVNLAKEGRIDENTGVITWKLKINNQSGFDLNGVVISDSKFDKAIDGSVKSNTDGVSIAKCEDNYDYKITSSTRATCVEIEYQTKLTDVVDSISINGGRIINEATISRNGHSSDKATARVNYSGVSISKTGELSDNSISWSIIVNNPYGLNLSSQTITDTMFQYSSDVSTDYGSVSGNTFTFNNNTTNQKEIIITYTTTLTKLAEEGIYNQIEGSNIINSASFNDKESVYSEVYVNGNITLDKYGTFDYEYIPSNTLSSTVINSLIEKYQEINNSVVWTIEVKANNGRNLEGTTIEDSGFNSCTSDGITVINKSNNSTVSLIQYTIDGNTLTINDASLTEIMIVYATTANGYNQGSTPIYTSNNSNTVSIGELSKDASYEGTYKPYNIEKNSSEVKDKLETWYITVKANGTASLDGFIIEDNMFSLAVDDIIVNGATGTLSDNKMTLNNCTNKVVTITYKTDAIDTDNNTRPSNTATLLEGDKEWCEDSAEQQDYTPKNEITKTYTGDNTIEIDGDNKGSKAIDWEIIVDRDAGFGSQDSQYITISDTMTAKIDETPMANIHYITEAQKNNIKVYYNYSNSNRDAYNLLDEKYYDIEISETSQYSTFSIMFKQVEDGDIDLSEVLSIKVKYTSTANVNGDNIEPDEVVNFLNTASVTGNDTPVSADTNVTKLNTKNQPFRKYGIDSNGEMFDNNAIRQLDDIPTIEIDGEDYYLFTWGIFLNGAKANGSTSFTDVLPEGFSMYIPDDENDYTPRLFWTGIGDLSIENGHKDENNNINFVKYYNDAKNQNGVSWQTNYSIGEYDGSQSQDYYQIKNDGTILFCFNIGGSNFVCARYTAKIKVADFEVQFDDTTNKVTINNTVQPVDQTIYEPYIDTQTILNGEIPNGTKEEIIDKTASESNDAKNLAYSINVNEDAKILSNTGELVLSDKFYITGGKIEGKDYSSATIDTSKFDVNITYFKVTEVNTGNDITQQCSYILSSPDSTTNANVVKILQIIVPDGKHLKVDYEYSVTCNYLPSSTDYLKTKNAVSVATGNYYDHSTATATTKLYSSAGGQVKTDYLEIIKYDLNNYSLKLNAGFTIARWNTTDKTWEYAIDISNGTTYATVDTWNSDGTKATITTDTNGAYKIKLDEGVLYKLVETQTPNDIDESLKFDYAKLKNPIYFINGVGDSSKEDICSDIPDADFNIDKVSDISTNKELQIANYQNIDITVQKSWDDGNEFHENDSVKVELYRSTIKTTTGFPSGLTKVIDNEDGETKTLTINSDSSWRGTFEDLPSGNENGEHYYYYVKEVSYTINSIEYLVEDGEGIYFPHYTGNGTNQTSEVDILNSYELIVHKVWKNADGIDITNSINHEDIKFQLLRSIDDGEPEVVEINGESEFILSKDNDWKYEFKGLRSTNEDGITYKYSVKEINIDPQYETTYLNNSYGNNGDIQIINKNIGPEKLQIEIEKQWADGNVNHVNDSVTLELYRKAVDSEESTLYKTIELSATDDWYWTSSVDAYVTEEDDNGLFVEQTDNEGNKIKYEYYFTETKVNDISIDNTDYTVTYNNNNINKDNNNKLVTVTNTPPAPPTMDITVNKSWAGYPSNISLPESITVILYKAYTDNAPESDWEQYETVILEPNIDGNWSYTFKELPQYLYYHVKEVTSDTWIPAYTIDNNKYTFASDFVIKGGTAESVTVNITNTYQEPDEFDISLTKKWDDKLTSVSHDPVNVMLIRSTKELNQAKLDSLSGVGTSPTDNVTLTSGGSSTLSSDIDMTKVDSITLSNISDYISMEVNFDSVANAPIKYENGQWQSNGYLWNVSITNNNDGSITIKPNSDITFNKITFSDKAYNNGCTFSYVVNYSTEPSTDDFTEIETSGDYTIEMYTKEDIALDSNGTPHTINDLPTKFTNEDGSDSEYYYYYVIEKDVFDDYEVSYSNVDDEGNLIPISFNNNDVTITNTLKTGTLTINKLWKDLEGNDGLSDDIAKTIGGIKVEVYQSTTAPSDIDTGSEKETPTDGTWISSGSAEKLLGSFDITTLNIWLSWLDNNNNVILDSDSPFSFNNVFKIVVNGNYSQIGFVDNDNSWNGKWYNTNSSSTEINGDDLKDLTSNKYLIVQNSSIKIDFYGIDTPLEIEVNKVIDMGDDKKVSISEGSSATITSNLENVTYSGYDDNIITIENGRIIAIAEGKTNIIATIDNKTVTIPVEVTEATTFTPILPDESNEIGTYDIEWSKGWSLKIINLPLQDANGQPYYYYVKEIFTEGVSYSYTQIDGDDAATFDYNNLNKTINITNKLTEEVTPSDEGVELPMTGGVGTTRYYLIGGTIVAIATLILVKKRRKF